MALQNPLNGLPIQLLCDCRNWELPKFIYFLSCLRLQKTIWLSNNWEVRIEAKKKARRMAFEAESEAYILIFKLTMQFLLLSNPKQNNLGAGVLKINYPVSEILTAA
jgi:hypothetical protein